MDTIGYAPNFKVLETLFYNACHYKNFIYVLHLMEYILHNNIKPTKKILNILEKFDELVLEVIENKVNYYNYYKLFYINYFYNYYLYNIFLIDIFI